jgi:hypothetical protein
VQPAAALGETATDSTKTTESTRITTPVFMHVANIDAPQQKHGSTKFGATVPMLCSASAADKHDLIQIDLSYAEARLVDGFWKLERLVSKQNAQC